MVSGGKVATWCASRKLIGVLKLATVRVMPLQEEGSEVVGACAGEGKKVTPAGCCAGLAVTLGICFPC